MTNGGLPIGPDEFDDLPLETKLSAIFKTLVYMHDAGYESASTRESFRAGCQARIAALEKSDIRTKGISGITGAITGFVTAFLQKPLF